MFLTQGDSSVLHGASCDAHNNHVIRLISARTFREHVIVFQSMSEVKKDDGLKLLNEYGDLHFLLHNFGIKNLLSPLNWGC